MKPAQRHKYDTKTAQKQNAKQTNQKQYVWTSNKKRTGAESQIPEEINIPYILEYNARPFYSFRGPKFGCVLDSRAY